jgi:hypothetical protein
MYSLTRYKQWNDGLAKVYSQRNQKKMKDLASFPERISKCKKMAKIGAKRILQCKRINYHRTLFSENPKLKIFKTNKVRFAW